MQSDGFNKHLFEKRGAHDLTWTDPTLLRKLGHYLVTQGLWKGRPEDQHCSRNLVPLRTPRMRIGLTLRPYIRI